MSLQKAKIIVKRKGTSKEEEIPVMFNPSEYKISKSVNFHTSEVQGKDPKQPVYENGDPATLDVELFFDCDIQYAASLTQPAKAEKNVRMYTERILSLLISEESNNDNLPQPPACKFIWGTFSFLGYVSSAVQTFTRFTPEGIPVRASVELTFTEIPITITYAAKQSEIQQYGTIPVNAQEQLCNQVQVPQSWRGLAISAGILNPRV